MNTKMNIPIDAMVFNAGKNTVKVKADTLSMVAYSGGLVRNHYYWGDLIIDLAGMSFPKNSYPVLEEHRKDRKVGVVKRSQIHLNGGIKIEDAKLLDTLAAAEFKKLSKESFPWQASIFARPTDIERLGEGAKPIKVNGIEVKPPASIWRQSIFFEVSVVVFGYDPNTESRVVPGFSNDSHLTLSLNVEGDLQDFQDEKLVMGIYNSTCHGINTMFDKDEKFLTDEERQQDFEDEKLAESTFRSSSGGVQNEEISDEDEVSAQSMFDLSR